MERRDPFYTAGRNVNWYSHSGEQYEGSLKIKHRAIIRSSYNPTFTHTPSEKHGPNSTCTPAFTAALFTAKTWKQPKRPLTGMNKEDVARIHNRMLFIKKDEIMLFATTWMDLEGVIPSEVRQRGKNIV